MNWSEFAHALLWGLALLAGGTYAGASVGVGMDLDQHPSVRQWAFCRAGFLLAALYILGRFGVP